MGETLLVISASTGLAMVECGSTAFRISGEQLPDTDGFSIRGLACTQSTHVGDPPRPRPGHRAVVDSNFPLWRHAWLDVPSLSLSHGAARSVVRQGRPWPKVEGKDAGARLAIYPREDGLGHITSARDFRGRIQWSGMLVTMVEEDADQAAPPSSD